MINLTTIAETLPEIDTVSLKAQLLSFALNYHQLRQGLFPGNDDSLSDLSDDSDDEEDVENAACKNCLSCAFCLLSQYKLCSTAYENLFLAYKYLVTLSVTKCSCERSFSKLKLIKTRLRLSLTQENLESLMIIPIEKELALELKNNKEDITDKFATSSKELSSLFTLTIISRKLMIKSHFYIYLLYNSLYKRTFLCYGCFACSHYNLSLMSFIMIEFTYYFKHIFI